MNWWSEPPAPPEVRPPVWSELDRGGTAPSGAPAEGGADEGEAHARRVEAEVAERLRAARAAARAEGFAEGVRAGEEALARARALRQELEEERAQLRAWLLERTSRLEEAALELAQSLAEAALARELAEPGRAALAEAGRLLRRGGEGAAVVRVAPEAASVVREARAELGEDVTVEADPSIAPGDAAVERAGGTLVSGPVWRWRRLVRALREEVPDHGGA
ncbi:MAG: hypothetical protein IRZ11_06420 [Clostridia bacterium]|nr:hypothetical protein [Clostridia bacterium]